MRPVDGSTRLVSTIHSVLRVYMHCVRVCVCVCRILRVYWLTVIAVDRQWYILLLPRYLLIDSDRCELVQWAVLSGCSTGSGFDLIEPSSQSSKHLCIFGFYGAVQVFKKIILTSLYLVEGLAWWDWLLTWSTDQLLSFSALTLLVWSSDP